MQTKHPELVSIKPYPRLLCLPQASAPQATVREAHVLLSLHSVACSPVNSHVQPHTLLFESQLFVCLLHARHTAKHFTFNPHSNPTRSVLFDPFY